MSIGVLHGQNGGAGLAVKVVGGTQKPSNAKQGVIWVNTDQKITGWTMQAEEPTEPTEGMVWIAILTPARLNALKKNGIWFTPTSAKQYSDGGWVKKTGEYYNNDQWVALFEATIHITYPAGSVCTATDGVTTLTAPDTSGTWDCVVPNAGDWTVALDSGFSEVVRSVSNGGAYTVDKWHIYNLGDECVTVTGGWDAIMSANNTAKESDCLYVYNPEANGTYGGTFATVNKIDLTNVNTIGFSISQKVGNNGGTGVITTAQYGDNIIKAHVANMIPPSAELDVSSFNGKYHVWVGGSTGSGGARISEIYLKAN